MPKVRCWCQGLVDNLLQNLHGFTLLDYAKPFENLLYSRISGNGFFKSICCTYKNFGR